MVFGGSIVHSSRIVHGKTSRIRHTETGIFKNIPNPFVATRYHSLVIDEKTLPASLLITAKSEDDNEIMGIQHREYPVFGIQFHPESILTTEGKQILKNFLNLDNITNNISISNTQAQSGNPIVNGLNKILSGNNLSYDETVNIMNQIMEGKATDAQISAFLIALRMKKETGEELAGMAKVMQSKSIKVNTFSPLTSDTCGTGGDGAGTFNISTATAFVVCAGGIPVAKHGNRSVSSKVGSADVLEAGGYNLQKTAELMQNELKETGFTFLFAPLLHPAMKNVMPARKQLKTRTAFNLLGPVTNPARVKYQIVGVFDFGFAEKLAKALQTLGTKKSVIVSGGFTDELTTCGNNKALLVTENEIAPLKIDITEMGLHPGNKEELAGETDPQKAFWLMQNVLSGKANRTQIETVALNAGMVFWITGDVETPKQGIEKALELIYSKLPLKKLEEVIEYQKK